MNREELKNVLLHREPMLLLDDSRLEGDATYSSYRVRGDEFFLQGHFPGNPVVPGVILCEIMAQSSAMLMPGALDGKCPMYAGMDSVKFKRMVVPGDTVNVTSKLILHRGPLFVVEAEATVEGQMCARGKLSFMVVDKETK